MYNKNMSLISETIATVVQASSVSIQQTFSTNFDNVAVLDGYGVISGVVEPRTVGSYYLVVNEETKEPIVLPPNSAPIKFIFNPINPISPLVGSGIGPVLSNNTQFGAVYKPFLWYTEDFQMMPNGSTVSADAGVNKSFQINSFAPYPYLCVEVFGTPGNNWTNGKIQIYLFYKTV